MRCPRPRTAGGIECIEVRESHSTLRRLTTARTEPRAEPAIVAAGVSPPGAGQADFSSLAFRSSGPEAAGQDARLYGRPEARPYRGNRLPIGKHCLV